MCGICGIINTATDNHVDQRELVEMRDSMTHRGPDEKGIYIDKNAGLGHRRLSIIDLAHGRQPMCNENQTIWITFNGEIYNFQSLRAELKKKGHIFKTNTDTEVIIHAYEEYGPTCVNKFNGMFAFAIWDANKRNLFLARDRLGIKPLYFSHIGGRFLFASEIKAILQCHRTSKEVNHKIIEEYLVFRYASGDATFFKNIYRLLPGHTLTWKNGRTSVRKYWDVSVKDCVEIQSDQTLLDKLHHLLEDSVRIRLMSDVPLGTFNSGGLDSSLVSAFASRLLDDSIDTFSVGFFEKDYDESEFARKVSNFCKTNHHEIRIRNTDFKKSLEKAIYHNDEPLNHPNSVQIYHLSRFAKNFVTVVLTGEGSDEIFGGYPRYNIPLICATIQNLPFLSKIFPTILTLLKTNRKVQKIHDAMKVSDSEMLIRNSAFVREELLKSVLKDNLINEDFHYRTRCLENFSGKKLIESLLYLDLKTYLVSILERQDKMSMAASIESRIPFLDHRLVDFSFEIPSNLKIRRFKNKYIVRNIASNYLPSEVIDRKKSGFGVPLALWFREEIGLNRYVEILRERRFIERGYFKIKEIKKIIDMHMSGKHDHSELIWMLINMELWHRIFVDPSSVS